MSIRAYRLLRNNEEQGPFTAEELIQKKLKPYDLIWIDGRSACWKYPGEMAEFKMYVPLAGEQTQSLENNQKENSVSASVQAAIAINNNIAQSEIKEKPRYKVSAAWSKIQTIPKPVYKNMVASEPKKKSSKKLIDREQSGDLQSKSLSWKEAWLDWEKEKESGVPVNEHEKLKEPVFTQSAQIDKNYTEPALETKYVQPLDALKDKYIENILLEKRQAKKSYPGGTASGFIVPTLAVVVIFSVGFWLLHSNIETTTALKEPLHNQQVKPVPTGVDEPASNTDNNKMPDAATGSTNEEKQTIAGNEPLIPDQAEERKQVVTEVPRPAILKHDDSKKQPSLAAYDPAPAKTEARQLQQAIISPKSNAGINNANKNNTFTSKSDPKPAENKTIINTAVESNISANLPLQEDAAPPLRNVHVKTSTDYVSVPEYIQINNGSANLKIENISNIDFDLVVIDVQYFDSLSQFRKGETLYLHNLRAGKDVIIKTPKDINSHYATSKVSLISSDSKQVYVVGDN
jgi:hypothetical protein